jgi:decaprenyl-phosphate phosphoribosyltransferase
MKNTAFSNEQGYYVKIIFDILSLLRVKQWIKNFFVFIPLFFSGRLTDVRELMLALLAYVSFNFVSSVVYIINDLNDIEADRLHPRKALRPIPSGRISTPVALIVAGLSLVVSVIIGFIFVNIPFVACIGLYLLINITYTYWGKHIAILDVLFIAAGFVLRVVAGSYAISVEPSGWLIMTTFFLSLFLGFGKRRNEFIALEKDKVLHRKVLAQYDMNLLNHFIFTTCTLSIISFALYTLSPSVIARFQHGSLLVYTIPFFTFCLFRYVFGIWKREEGDPTEVVLHDVSLILSIVLTVALTLCFIYIPWRF